MSHSHPKRIKVIVIAHLLTFFLICEQQFVNSAERTSALSDAQLKEIAKIRSELNEALEAEQENVAAKGVIVQPSWTSKQGKTTDIQTKVKVEVTQERIDEVNLLRAEINKSKIQQTENDHQVQELIKEFNAQGAGRSALEKVVGASQPDGSELVGMGEQVDPNTRPNVVEASVQEDMHEFDLRKLQRLEISRRRLRETLVLKSIEEDYTFDLGDDVQQWEHIRHNGSEYFVGRREQSLLVVHKESATYRTGTVLEINQPITYLLTYNFWNDVQAQTEGITLVATQDRVLWYRVSDITHKLELYWQWVVGNTVTGLTHFTVEHKNYLIVSTNQSSHSGLYTLNIYQFELGAREFWIAQRMQLEFPCVETTLLDTGRDLVLAVPQNNTAAIYNFNPRADSTDYLRFKLKQHIVSEDIESVAAFRMGGRSYIAIGGQQPQILLYQQGELVPKTILAHNFGVVQLFFPVPVRTYRDDLILLVQHRVDFATHSLTVLETLIWDGEAFEASIPVPCKLGVHTVYGVSCMLDIQREAGLKGAAYFRRGDEVSLIVPRHNAESGLFRLHTDLLAKNSEYLDLQDIYAFLKDWVKEQDDLVAQAQSFLQMGGQTQPDLSELEELQTPELTFAEGEVGEIYLNDYLWTAEDTQIDLDRVITAIEQLEADINGGRHRRDALTDELNFEHLVVDSLDVERLTLKQLNGEDFYVQNGMLDFDGLLNLQDLKVSGHLRAAAPRSSTDRDANEQKDVKHGLDEVENETLVLDGDLFFESINGMRWQELLENMVFKNVSLNLTQLEVDGEVIIEDKLSLNKLNSLNFPEDLLWSNGSAVSVVRAEKTFTETLSTNALDVEGLLNGVNTSDAITLQDKQDWQGLPTFADLTIAELLQLNGTTRGRDVDELPHNPTLREVHSVEATCTFKQLQVLGALKLKGHYDGQPLSSILSDIVQRPDDPETVITVAAKKRFNDLHAPVDFEVLDGKVNGLAVSEFVPVHTKQELFISNIQAYVYFSNLTINGKYDGIDIAELVENTLKVDEPQLALETRLQFAEVIYANAVKVQRSLNEVPIAEGYQSIYEDLQIPKAHFEQLNTKEGHITGDIKAAPGAKLFGDQQTQSTQATAHKQIGDIYVDELKLAHGLEVDEIQGINASLIWSFLDDIDDLPEMVLDGKVQVDRVAINGDVHVHKLNQQRFDEDLQLTIVWLNRPNYLSTNLKFTAPLTVHGNLQVARNFNDINLQAFIDDMVLRVSTNGTQNIIATKSFTQSVHVSADTYVDALNGILFTDIATKKTISNFRGSVRLLGELVVQDLEITGALNGQPMSMFSSSLRYDRPAQAFIVQGVTHFRTPEVMRLQDLTVFGALNDMSNIQELFEQLVYKDKACVLKGHNIFTGRVGIDRGAYIRNLNGYNLLALFANIVYVQEPQPVLIRAPITFKGSVRAENIFVQDALEATTLNGFGLTEWFTDTLRLDRPQEISQHLIFAPGSLDGNSLYASYLNDIDLSQVVTLHTRQNLTGNLTFSELKLNGQIYVQGLVNGVDLQTEYSNTFMKHGHQVVFTPLTLQSALVRNNLQTNAPINNDKDLQEVATLQGDQHFESPLYFGNVTTKQLKTKFYVSGIDLNKWFQGALRSRGKPQQLITGNWSVRTLTVKSGPTLPDYYINSGRPRPLPFDALIRNVREGKDYEHLCEKFRGLVRKQQRRGYYLKYLERSFELALSMFGDKQAAQHEAINTVFSLGKDGANYLLINTGARTHLMKWQPQKGNYVNVCIFVSGALDQAFAVMRAEELEFITNKAGVEGALKHWRLSDGKVILVRTYETTATDLLLTVKLYALHENILYAHNLSESKHSDACSLPNEWGKQSFRFVPQHIPTLMLTNGAVILRADDDDDALSERDKRTTAPRYSLPLYYQRVISPQAHKLSEDAVMLKPNASYVTHEFRLADFRRVIVNILEDLNYRLHLEVNITQLSIPETDLHDEHLIADFLDIMQQLSTQQIYPNVSFESLEYNIFDMPENPAQILAARTVQILWPHIVDMAEMQGYLATNIDEHDVTVANILEQLGTTVREVLVVANSEAHSEQVASAAYDATAEHAWELSLVIERIRALQTYLARTAHTLKTQLRAATEVEEEYDEDEDEEEVDPDEANADLFMSASESIVQTQLAKNSTLTIGNFTWSKFLSTNLPAPGEGEILQIMLLALQTPLEILAVTRRAPQPLVGVTQQSEIVLYLDVLRDVRFQTISARQPTRSLSTLQIASETLLAYVEGCCTVRVLIYRGVQGFIEFASFETDSEVLKIFTVALQQVGDVLVAQPHLGIVHDMKIVYYRFVGAGSVLRLPEDFNCT
ncbi:uncharacterized protein LOC101452473 [Ceratitis capitata]|uniref:uncharacterized protein LOC101452473 n=1 Tax=Ceratitis capitata TaxID=7213 RepID=UPI000329A28E|nr:uncharacterized protein LOC101452473 [Ceratitis capitata]